MNLKLTQEEREEIALLSDAPAWEALQKVIEAVAQDIEGRLLTYTLLEGAEGLVHAKARVEGARQLQLKLLTEVRAIAKKEFKK